MKRPYSGCHYVVFAVEKCLEYKRSAVELIPAQYRGPYVNTSKCLIRLQDAYSSSELNVKIQRRIILPVWFTKEWKVSPQVSRCNKFGAI